MKADSTIICTNNAAQYGSNVTWNEAAWGPGLRQPLQTVTSWLCSPCHLEIRSVYS